MLCKHEVVGSIPSGSTTLRLSGFAWHSLGKLGEACPAKLARAKTGSSSLDAIKYRPTPNVRENMTSHVRSSPGADMRDF